MFLVILLYALFASLFSLQKATLLYSEPFFFVGSRMAFAGSLLLIHQFFWNPTPFKIRWDHVKYLFLLGFLNIYLTNIAEVWGLQHMVSSKACLIYSLSPFLAAIVSYWVLKERLSKKKCLGLCIGLIGLIPIFMMQTGSEILSGKIWYLSLAELAVFTAVVCSVSGWVILKKVINEFHYTPLMANGVSMLLGGSFALLHSYVSGEHWTPVPVTHWKPFLQNTLWLCVISNLICYNLYGYLLKRYSATFMSFAGLVTPLFAVFFGWFTLNERVTWHTFVSMIIFSLGLTLFYHEELKRDKVRLDPLPSQEAPHLS